MLRLEATQSGGLVPISRVWRFDSASAAAHEAREVEHLLDRCGFFNAPEPPAPVTPDRELLFISVESDRGSRAITLAPGSVPDPFLPLVHFIEARLVIERRP